MATQDDSDMSIPGSLQADGEPELFRSLFDAIPSPALIVDRDVRILAWNEAAADLVGTDRATILHQKNGDAFRCLESTTTPNGCGHSAVCGNCVIRNAVGSTFQGVEEAVDAGKVTRQKTRLRLIREDQIREAHFLVTASPMYFRGARRALIVLEDVSELVVLQGLLPICAWCHRVRNTDSYWESIEHYLQTRVDVGFTHSICEDCYAKVMAEGEKDR
jgi:PAS domain-containing protein